MNKPHAIFFDLDGTLLDTAQDIYAAACRALHDLNLPPPPFSEARSYIGDGMDRFIKRLLTGERWAEPCATQFKQCKTALSAHYARQCLAGSYPYPLAQEALKYCQQNAIKTACVTNKPLQFTLPLLNASQFRHYFSYIHCGDTSEHKKPHPLPLITAAQVLSTDLQNCLMVGDTVADSKAATAAGVRYKIVSYGYHLPPLPSENTIDNLLEIFS